MKHHALLMRPKSHSTANQLNLSSSSSNSCSFGCIAPRYGSTETPTVETAPNKTLHHFAASQFVIDIEY